MDVLIMGIVLPIIIIFLGAGFLKNSILYFKRGELFFMAVDIFLSLWMLLLLIKVVFMEGN